MIDIYRNLPLSFYLTFAGIFGLIFGSFANVLIWRLPRKQSIMKPGSYCPHCNHPIRWFDNIPVLSYLFLLRGKCRDCHQSISIRYPIVELIIASLSVWGVAVWQGDPVRQLLAVALAPIVIALSMIDIEMMELPDSLVTTIAVLGLIASPFAAVREALAHTGGTSVPFAMIQDALIQTVVLLAVITVLSLLWRWVFGADLTPEEEAAAEQAEPTIKERLIWGGGAFLVGLFMVSIGFFGSFRTVGWNAVWGLLAGGGGLLFLWGFFLFLQGREAIGLGDVKLMAALGIITGPGRILVAYVIGAILGIAIWTVLRITKNHKTDQPFPFGPALISGAWVAWLHGEQFLNWYMRLLFPQ